MQSKNRIFLYLLLLSLLCLWVTVTNGVRLYTEVIILTNPKQIAESNLRLSAFEKIDKALEIHKQPESFTFKAPAESPFRPAP
ncbi:MAG: hypothetical protein JW795_13740, partial [Chitinivibrionales bacterium]|nr:hypothetical protein [Chitinivibrionales bacterium]